MNGPTDSGTPTVEAGPDTATAFLNDEAPGLVDWLERIVPVALGASAGAARVSETERLTQFGAGTAEMATLRSRAAAARWAGDEAQERSALARLARIFVGRGYQFASAVHAARRALQLGADDELRGELSQWLEGLGDPAGAAKALRPLLHDGATAREKARLLTRIGRLLVRAGESPQALEALLQAAQAWDGTAEPLELAGVLAAAMGRTDAAAILMQSAGRHELLGAPDKALEARRRAFEVEPSEPACARALLDMLQAAGRTAAADELLRLHAQALPAASAREVHRERAAWAMEGGDAVAALQALIDGHLLAAGEGTEAELADQVLEKLGLFDWLAQRLELRAAAAPPHERAALLMVQARWFAGKLASPDRALEAWIEALGCDPGNEAALQALRAHANTMRDPMPLVEALLRAASVADAPHRADHLRELQALADERLADPSLALWALEARIASGSMVDDAQGVRDRLLPRARLQDGALLAAREALEHASGEARVETLRRMAAILRGRPDNVQQYLGTLCELLSLSDDDRRWWVDLERAALRAGRAELLEEQVRIRLERGVAKTELPRLRTQLVALAIRRGELPTALAEARALVRELPGSRPASLMLWLLADIIGDRGAQAEALELVAPSVSARLRAALQAIAADDYLSLGEVEQAQRLAELAARNDPSEPRVLAVQGRLAHAGARVDVRLLEKACSTFLPGHRLLEGMALGFDRLGERNLALSWARRAYELCPWELRLLDGLMVRATVSGRPEPVAEIVMQALGACFPMTLLAPILDKGLRALSAFDPAQAAVVAQAVLEAEGPCSESIRALILDIASGSRNARLAAVTLERWLAAGAHDDEQGRVLEQLVGHYHELGDADGEALALVRLALQGQSRERAQLLCEQALASASADGVLARAQARAVLLDRDDGEASEPAAQAWRLLGAALWDLAGDRKAAVSAWVRASEFDPSGGPEKLACDLEAFAGEDDAHVLLRDHAAAMDDERASARLMALSAAIALRNGRPETALESGLGALQLDPTRTDALVVIERSADQCNRPEAIDAAYHAAARGALGRLGRRAAHYRAARELERRARPALAVNHAIAAFEADPLDGAVLRFMLKLAQRAEPMLVVHALQRAADTEPDEALRALWLQHGASVALRSASNQRLALDLVLNALNVSPDGGLVQLLGEVMSGMLAAQPDERDILEMRMDRLLKATLPKLEGPRGARLCVDLARVCVDAMGARALAVGWLHGAVGCSGDIDEYQDLVEVAGLLSAERAACERLIDEVIQRAETRSGPVGASLLTLASTLAYAMDDGARGDALVDVAQKTRALGGHDDPFAGFGDVDEPGGTPDMFSDLADSIMPGPMLDQDAEQGEALVPAGQWDDSAPAAAATQEAAAEVAPSRAQQIGSPMAPPAIQPIGPAAEPSLMLGAVLSAADQLATEAQPADERVEAAPDPLARARALQERGELHEAAELMESALAAEPSRAAEFDAALRELYGRTGRNAQLRAVLDRMAVRAETSAARVELWAEGAALSEARGEGDEARARWAKVFEADAWHEEAWGFLERDARARGDYRGLAAMLRTRVDAAPDRATAVAVACRAANGFLGQGLDQEAREAIAWLGEPLTAPALEVRVAIERRGGDAKALGNALEELASSSIEDRSRRSRWLVQAADASMLYGNGQEAVDRALRAAAEAPDDPSIQLYATSMQYKVEGLGNLTQVRAMGARLDGVSGRIGIEDIPLHAYLASEVAGVLYGPEAALEVLGSAHGQAGLHPLIALGMAERLAATGSVEHALPLFESALSGGDLQGVRTPGQVAFAAGRAALRARSIEQAEAFLGMLQERTEASELAARLAADIDAARLQAAEPSPDAPGVEPGLEPRPTLEPKAPPEPLPPVIVVSPGSPAAPAPPEPHITVGLTEPDPDTDEPPPSMSYVPVHASRTEQELFGELAGGSIEAGDELAALLGRDASRTHDVAAVRRRQVVLEPTNLRLLQLLRDCAAADRNQAHADAVEHVLVSLQGQVTPPPAPMQQHEQPERVLAMLLRGVHTTGAEVFGHVWTHAPLVMSREAPKFELASMELVPFGAPSPVGKAYAAAVRVLGLGKVGVYCHRSRAPMQTALALTAPPSVVLTGEIQDTIELRHKLTAILAASLPANVMLFGLPEEQIRVLMEAMAAAFGPPQAGAGMPARTVQLAGQLWNALPVRVQRRMNELFAQPSFTYEDTWARALQSTRRAALFVVGDVSTAIRDTLDDPGVRDAIDLQARDHLVQICRASASATDLVRLATSAEYAEARWRTEGPKGAGVRSAAPRREGA